MRWRVLMLAAFALLGASCLTDYGESPFACTKSPACPEGYRCVNQVCRREGTAPPPPSDARIDRPSSPTPDARASDLPVIVFDHFRGKEPVATFPDLPGGLTCKQINDCYGTCNKSNHACFDACFNMGSADGKAKMQALETCDELAWKGVCAYACNISQQACDSCIDSACAPQIAACFP